MRRHTNLRLPMLGATVLVALSLVAGVCVALAHCVAAGLLADVLVAVVGALGAAFLVASPITALYHAKQHALSTT
ncbi:MAG: hypothetical protein Q4A01_08025 [Coriobacteriales bacterium]|nr:hypothetical protein [Coriobacteriales bacterium]